MNAQPEPRLTYNDSNKISWKNSHPYMQQIQHQMFDIGRLYCNFELFPVRQSVAIKTTKDFNYTNDVEPKKLFLWWSYCSWGFYKKYWKSPERVTRRYWEAYGKVRNHKKATGWPGVSSAKKVLVKISNWHSFLMTIAKYKVNLPLYDMELQRLHKKVKLFKLIIF